MLYRLTINQSDCRKTGPYQFPYNKIIYCIHSIRCPNYLRHFNLTLVGGEGGGGGGTAIKLSRKEH